MRNLKICFPVSGESHTFFARKKDFVWLILGNFINRLNELSESIQKRSFDTWNAFNSLLVKKPVKTNHGVVAPLLRSPPTSPQTLYTALCLAQKINSRVLGDGKSTVLTLDLDLYERAVKIRANTNNIGNLILRMGELHIMFALLKSLGKFIEGSGIDDIWIENGLYGAAVVRQIFSGKFLKRGVEAHLINLIALMGLYLQHIEQKNDRVKSILYQIPKNLDKAVNERNHDSLLKELDNLSQEIEEENIFDSFDDDYDKHNNETATFLCSYMKQIMNLLTFIRATREGDFNLHLRSLDDNIKYFFAHDLYKYARLSPYYLADMQKLKEEDPYAWNLLESGEIFSVTKSEIPFCGLGVDQGLEQEIRALKVVGGIVGITQNKSAMDRYFLIAPEILRILDSFWSQFGKNKDRKEHHHFQGTISERIISRSFIMKESVLKHIENPFANNFEIKELINISNNVVMPDNHELCKRDQIGLDLHREFIIKRLKPVLGPMESHSLWSPMRKRKLNTFTALSKPIKQRSNNETINVKEERSLLTRFLLIQQGRPDLIQLNDAIGNYEFSAIPRSLFDGNGVIRIPSDKFEIMNEIESSSPLDDQSESTE